MDVQQLLDRERGVRQLQSRENSLRATRWQENLPRQERNCWRLAELERRAWAACGPGEILRHAIAPRPFDDLVSRMAEQSRDLQRLTDDLTRSAIGNALSQTMKMGETCRRLIDPIPALKTALEPFTVAPAFDAMRYVTPLAELERQVSFLRDHPFSRLTELRSTAWETMRNISAIVDLVKPYTENPLFQTESVAGNYFDLGEVVQDAGLQLSFPDSAAEMADVMRGILSELKSFRDDQAGGRLGRTIAVWAAVVGVLLQVYTLYDKRASENHKEELATMQQQQLASPSPLRPDEYEVGPCP